MKINLIAPINQLGYGQVGKNVLKALSDLEGVEVALFPIGRTDPGDVQDILNVYNKSISNAMFPYFGAPTIRIWHQHDMSQFVGSGPHIGFPIFELDQLTQQERYHLNNLDGVFVCSRWAKEIVYSETKHTKDKIHVVPLGVNNYGMQSSATPGATKFFTCGKWEVRKGHDVLVEAFNRAFTDDDNVELHLMCTNPFLSDAQNNNWMNLYLNSPLGHKVRFVPRVKNHHEVISIMNSMDCGVFISRAEGWNLELLEMMSLGKPVIATNYSGHTEFCNQSNSYLIDINEMEPASDGIWFHMQGNWAKLGEFQINTIADDMYNIHQKKSSRSGLQFDNLDGIETGKKFTWENTAREIINGINNISNISAST